MDLYERYGRLLEERLIEHEHHLRTIAVLRDVVSGALPRERVQVSESGWAIQPTAADPVGELFAIAGLES